MKRMWVCLFPFTIAASIFLKFEPVEETSFSEHSNSNVCNEHSAKQH